MEIRLLGPLEVHSRGRAVEVAGRRLRLLLAVLALQPGQVVAAERLIELLWAEASPPADPVNALQALVSRLRRALEAASGGERVASRPSGYLLAVEPDQVDALRFERLCRDGHEALAAGRHLQAAATLREALGLWRGQALAEFATEPFAAANATRLEELHLGALEDRIEAELALGEHARLVGELEVLAAEHPLRERLHALLMRALYAAGRQADALAAYQRVRRGLAEQAGLDPGEELRRVEQAILAQDPSLRAAPAAPEPAASAPAARPGRGNLPGSLTSFVGREEELAQVVELLGRHRLVTLTGPGGVGKTRLAVEAARRLGAGRSSAGKADGDAPDATWLVELAGLASGRLVAVTVLGTLGMVERPRLDADEPHLALGAADATDRLVAALERHRTLLVLDNCEHLAEQVAALAERLLAACPGVRVLATSREPLRVPGEVRWPVPALPVPPPGPLRPEQLAGFAAARLFLDRAGAAVPGFAVAKAADTAAVGEVCRRLDGLPLAIELAAARVGALPPRQLAARLDDRFRLLTAGARTALPRQQTLRAVVDWSWELLEPRERAALRRLAVFVGGCTLDAAEAVCAGPDLPAAAVAEAIARLVDKSLVAVGPTQAPPAPWWPGIEALGLPAPPQPEPAGGTVRYGLLETVRAYAAERLAEAGEADRLARAHADWCVRLAETAEPRLNGSEQLAWFARLGAELDNLRAGWQWLLDRGEAEPAVRLLGSLGFWLLMTGDRQEVVGALKHALALPGPVPDRPRGLALYVLCLADADQATDHDALLGMAKEAQAAMERGALTSAERAFAGTAAATLGYFFIGGAGEAEQALDEALDEVERAGGWPAALIRQLRGFARAMRGNLAGAAEDGEVCLARFRELGDRWGMVQALELLGSVDVVHGRYERAEARLREALRCAWELRVPGELVVQLSRLAYLAVAQDDLDRAEAQLEQALAAAQEFGLGGANAFAHAGLALVAQRRHDAERAGREYQQALAARQRPGARNPVGPLLLVWLGTVATRQGDLVGAAGTYAELLELMHHHSDSPSAAAGALEGLAGLAGATGDLERAVLLLGAAAAARRSAGVPRSPAERVEVDRLAATARAALGEEGFARVLARGEALPLREAIALAERSLAESA
jgi:predicted ATPase/DNA-binding SARP family transcriptional activator/tetratricopeptide (TPR) repeat protein